MTGFKNPYLSVSRLRRFEQCPLSFQLHYIDRLKDEPTDALRFGTFMHAVLERYYQWVIEEEYEGLIDRNQLVALYREEWTQSGLSGFAMYEEGLRLLKAYVGNNPSVDHRDVLAVEQEFLLNIGDFDIYGKIDRVDRVDDDTIEVLDYKTNRNIYTRDEVEEDLQLTVYAMAARQLWPWAKQVRLVFYLLRHSMRMVTTRSEEQIEAACEYIATLGWQTENWQDFPARINANCGYCDHRQHCPAYEQAVAGKVEVIKASDDDLDALAREREQVASLARILYRRKDEIEKILKTRLKKERELELGGKRYSLEPFAKETRYPIDATLRVLAGVADMSEDELRQTLLAIDKAKVDALVRKLGKTMPRAQHRLLKTELDTIAKKTFGARLYARAAR